MRNLKLVCLKEVDLGCPADTSIVIATTPEQDAITYALKILDTDSISPTCELIKIQPYSSNQIETVFTFPEDTVTEFLAPVKKLKKISYCSTVNSILIASEAGGFFLLDLKTFGLGELFVAPSGITDFALSADSRLLAVATKEETLILFSFPDVEIVANIELAPQRPSDSDDRLYEASVCWREDSQYVAVNFFDGEKRVLKVFDDVGNPHSEGEASVNVVSRCLDWQSVDGLIGVVATTPTSVQNITFFELNGLKRSEFDLHDKEETITSVCWNGLADILALQKTKSVELWVRANYVWMLKKTIRDARNRSVSHITWEKGAPYRLQVLWENSVCTTYELSFSYTTGQSGGSAIAASINGPNVFCTPFRDNCAPPPKCWTTAVAPYVVSEVMVPEFWSGIATVSFDGQVQFFKLEDKEFVQMGSAKCVVGDDSMSLQIFYNWRWIKPNEITCISAGALLTFELQDTSFLNSTVDSKIEVVLKSTLKVRAKLFEPVLGSNASESNFLIVQKQCGAMLLQEVHNPKNVLLGRMPRSVTKFCVIMDKEKDVIDENTVLLMGYDDSVKSVHVLFQLSSYKVLSDCLSLSTFGSYALITTLQGTLEIVDAEALRYFCENEAKVPLTDRIYTRKVEKGSQIVNCCCNRVSEPALTLQIIPRGNLETISPRPLIYDSIGLLLTKGMYNEVMLAMRRHRLDFNVLASKVKGLIQPEKLEMELKSRLKALAEGTMDPHTLVLMLTELGEIHGDCVLALKEIFDDKLSQNQLEDKLINPYLAVQAKLQLLEEALKSPLISGTDLPRDIVKGRIKFLGFYCDNVDLLYEAALGTYDLALASQVADCLNKDPKEYVPILDEYRSMTESQARFQIDNNLKRYTKAAVHLVEDPNVTVDEVLKYIEKHRIHSAAIQRLRQVKADDPGIVKRVENLLPLLYRSYGDELETQKRHQEAGICYARGLQYEKSAASFGLCGNWSAAVQSIILSDQQPRVPLFKKLVSDLELIKEFNGAARVAESYLLDLELATHLYLKAKDWRSALRISIESPDGKSLMVSELVTASNDMVDQCGSAMKEFSQYGERLRTVLKLRAEANKDGMGPEGDNFSDTESMASSAWSSRGSAVSSSQQSGKTYRSGKNSRKLKRKLFSLKEGSRFEDIAIKIHLWELAERVMHEFKSQVEMLVSILLLSNLDEEAAELSASYENLVKTADIYVTEIWSTVLPPQDSLDLKYCAPPRDWSTNWNSCLLLK